MVPYNPVQLMVVAHQASGQAPTLTSVQLNAAQIVAKADPGFSKWPAATFLLGAVPPLDLAAVFQVSGKLRKGTIAVNAEALAASPSRDAILSAFLAVQSLQVTLNANNVFPVELRALLTSTFALQGTVASGAYPPGVSGNLICGTCPPGGSDTPFTDFVPNFATGPGPTYPDAPTLTPGALGATQIDLPVGAEPPASPDLFLKVVRNFSAAWTPHSVVPVTLTPATELAVLLDRSGRMLSEATRDAGLPKPKWVLANELAHMLNTLVGQLIPERFLASGAPLRDQIKLGFLPFREGGLDPGALDRAPGQSIASLGDAPASDGASAIGKALLEVTERFSLGPGSTQRLRRVLLLSDGFESAASPTPRLGDLNASVFPARTDDAARGVLLQNICLASDGAYSPALSGLVAGHEGSFDAAIPDAGSASNYRASLLHRLPDMLSLGVSELPTPTDSTVTVVLEPGAEKAVVLATQPNPSGLTLGLVGTPAGALRPDVVAQNEADFGYTWLALTNPAPGRYQISNVPAGARLFVLYDVAIRTEFSARSSGLGRPIHLTARATYRGQPIRAAHVTARLRVPSGSLGEELTDFAKGRGLAFAIAGGALNGAQLRSALASEEGLKSAEGLDAQACQGEGAPASAAPSVREQLTQAYRVTANVARGARETTLELSETAPGLYEATLEASEVQNEGNAIAEFRVQSLRPAPFTRTGKASVFLESLPDFSESYFHVGSRNGQVQVDFLPRNELGRPLGPGLASLFEFVGFDNREEPLPFSTRDLQNGTYQAAVPRGIDAERYRALERIDIVYARGTASERIYPVRARLDKGLCHVRVVLDEVEIVAANEPWWAGSPEFVFWAQVTPTSSPALEQFLRLGGQDGIELHPGERLRVERAIFDGVVERGAELAVSISGEELDWPWFLDASDRLSRYCRVIRVDGVPRAYGPGDESNDPESLCDFRVRYHIEYPDLDGEEAESLG